jgi:hypothetical protein
MEKPILPVPIIFTHNSAQPVTWRQGPRANPISTTMPEFPQQIIAMPWVKWTLWGTRKEELISVG